MARRPNGWTVLVADDDEPLRETLTELLWLEGFTVATARDGLEAVFAAVRMRPSVVLLDMKMPKVDGWNFADHLRANRLTVPIVVMSAVVDPKETARKIGAKGWVSKPFEVEDLLLTVYRACA